MTHSEQLNEILAALSAALDRGCTLPAGLLMDAALPLLFEIILLSSSCPAHTRETGPCKLVWTL